jgi:hypothetical protein
MTNWTTKRAIAALRCILGVVVLWASCQLLWATIVKIQAAPEPGHVGLHAWTLLVLASVEIAGAMLLAPVVSVAGSYQLPAVFAFGIFFHLLQRQFDVGALLVYAVAVLVWLAHRREARTGVRDEHRS